MKQKWRGIKTTAKPKFEDAPRTAKNRLGQLTISLPRITDDKRWAGYAGLAGVAKKIARMVPFDTIYYVEPLAGTAKVYQELVKLKQRGPYRYVLNDKAPFVFAWLLQEFGNLPWCNITNYDFTKCVKLSDTRKTFFLFDGPWFRGSYDQKYSHFDRESVKQYDQEIVDLCNNLQGKFIIASRKENKTYLAAPFNHKLIKSKYVVSGHYPKVLITTNLDV